MSKVTIKLLLNKGLCLCLCASCDMKETKATKWICCDKFIAL